MSTYDPLPSTCVVTTKRAAIYRDKGNGTEVRYYLFPEYEIHANTVAPATVQDWHHHSKIVEALYVTAGRLEARWLEDGRTTTRQLERGDMVAVGSSIHTFANPSTDDPAEFLVFRFVPEGIDKRDLIKNDRHPDETPEGP
jgi:uncharacterized RmlC-like cupin family protein